MERDTTASFPLHPLFIELPDRRLQVRSVGHDQIFFAGEQQFLSC
jgi:hypothetical protein